ncbi:MAG: hypothetical protein J6N72_00740, partial [Psychrobacter sp.]|nr:hypothetical protein [Psychrobacter sp.]
MAHIKTSIPSNDRSLSQDSEANINNISTEQAAFTSLPTNIQTALAQNNRLVFIANNPSIGTDQLEALLQP